MSDPNFAFANFVNVFQRLVDPDEGQTLAAITPILGDQANKGSLEVISKLLTSFFFDTIDLSQDSYVSLRGIRIPITAFRFLKELVEETPPGVLDIVANHLAQAGTDDVFPDTFVGQNLTQYLSDDEYSDPSNTSISKLVSEAKIKLHAAATGSSVNLDDFVADATRKLRFSSSLPGEEH